MKLKSLFLLSALPVLLLLLNSCESKQEDKPGQPVQIDLTLKQALIVNSGNSFAFDIFNRVLNSSDNENIMLSPLSISYALSMTANGAAGATRDSMLNTLGVSDLSIADLNTSFRNLTEALLSVDSKVNIKIANSVWTEDNFSVKEPFINTLTDYYSAESKSFDILDPDAPDLINSWIEDKTNGLIKDMISDLEDNTVMLLINAIYFKGIWKYDFDKTKTADRPFTTADGSEVSVPTMSHLENHLVHAGSDFVMVELPYGQGNYVMDIILPDNNDIVGFSERLTEEAFISWISAMVETPVNLYLPKFKYGFFIKLNDILTAMGMGITFGEQADFSNISDIDLLINEVSHKSFIETNEEGTEAAAATVVNVGTTSVNPNSPITVDVRRPFIYIIRESTTNATLFMGKVGNPLLSE